VLVYNFNLLVPDVQKPKFTSCPSKDISVNTNEKQGTAIVTWGPIQAKDNDGLKTKMSVLPYNIRPTATSHEFLEGTHYISFTATDHSGNSDYCIFKVTVKGRNTATIHN